MGKILTCLEGVRLKHCALRSVCSKKLLILRVHGRRSGFTRGGGCKQDFVVWDEVLGFTLRLLPLPVCKAPN